MYFFHFLNWIRFRDDFLCIVEIHFLYITKLDQRYRGGIQLPQTTDVQLFTIKKIFNNIITANGLAKLRFNAV